jgi:hypothetical protein
MRQVRITPGLESDQHGDNVFLAIGCDTPSGRDEPAAADLIWCLYKLAGSGQTLPVFFAGRNAKKRPRGGRFLAGELTSRPRNATMCNVAAHARQMSQARASGS